MLERRALLARQVQPARRRAPNALPVASDTRCRSRSAINSPRLNRCSVSIISRGEPILAAPVLAQRDQVGRAAHRAHRR
jgi:hypothetical protein